MNARNASGNTPLHVCAVNSQESCARLLLFRGCERDALNYANQTPYQVAVIAGNLELAEVIQNHRPEDVGELVRYVLCMHKHSLPGKYKCVPWALQLIALAPDTHTHTHTHSVNMRNVNPQNHMVALPHTCTNVAPHFTHNLFFCVFCDSYSKFLLVP